MNDEVSLRRAAGVRFQRATKDVGEQTRRAAAKGLLAGLLIALLSIGVVYGAHLLFR